MTVYEFCNKCFKDEEFNRGGIVTNERKLLDAVGFEYTVKMGIIQNVGEDANELYKALAVIKNLNDKYAKKGL